MTTRLLSKARRNKLLALLALIVTVFVTSCSAQGVTSADGIQEVDITLEGGSGKAYINSPVTITSKEGKSYATLVWSSKNYDYVIVGNEKYLNENPGGASTFTVPVASFDEPFTFIADTVAMSKPHEIEYTIRWNDTVGSDPATDVTKPSKDIVIDGLAATGEVELKYAKGFKIVEYGELSLISIPGSGDFLLVPSNCEVPDGVPKSVTILKQPLDKTYIVSTSVMDLVRQCDSLDPVRFSSLREGDWDIAEANEYMKAGKILYAGRYRAPDYELLLSEGCNFAIENTMIRHEPEVKEKLEELGIPVLVETSSYENEPLGRLEWIKLYGLLFGHETEAVEFFDKEAERIEALSTAEDSGKTVAFFSVSSTGLITVRRPGDYVTKLIELAGGSYVPASVGLADSAGSASMNMQPEDFYAAAKDADVLIYNSTIEDELKGVSDLISKSPMFSDYKAVKDGNVYCLSSDYFQNTTKMADLIEDIAGALSGRTDGMNYIYRLDNDNE